MVALAHQLIGTRPNLVALIQEMKRVSYIKTIRVLGLIQIEIPEKNHTIQQPTLLISSGSFITTAADYPSRMKSLALNFINKKLAAGHWIMLELPDQVNKILEDFFSS